MTTGKRYYWLKLKDDFFTSKRVKKLRKMAGGDTYLIIYLKLQLMAMKNDGIIEWTGLENNIADELALDLDEEPDNVKVTLSYLLSCGLAESSDEIHFFFPYSVENTGSETSSAQRVRECRSRKALQCNADVTQVKQECNGEKEIEKELEIDTDLEIEQEEENNTPQAEAVNFCPFVKIKNLYHTICVSYPRIKAIDGNRKTAVAARWRSYKSLDKFEEVFRLAESSPFLKGENDRNWAADFDWMMKPTNFSKILEHKYDARPASEIKPTGVLGTLAKMYEEAGGNNDGTGNS